MRLLLRRISDGKRRLAYWLLISENEEQFNELIGISASRAQDAEKDPRGRTTFVQAKAALLLISENEEQFNELVGVEASRAQDASKPQHSTFVQAKAALLISENEEQFNELIGVASRAQDATPKEGQSTFKQAKAALLKGDGLGVRLVMGYAKVMSKAAIKNTTQRGNTSTAMGGSVASAIRFIAKDLLTLGDDSQFWEPSNNSRNAPNPADLGEPSITKFLHDVHPSSGGGSSGTRSLMSFNPLRANSR